MLRRRKLLFAYKAEKPFLEAWRQSAVVPQVRSTQVKTGHMFLQSFALVSLPKLLAKCATDMQAHMIVFCLQLCFLSRGVFSRKVLCFHLEVVAYALFLVCISEESSALH